MRKQRTLDISATNIANLVLTSTTRSRLLLQIRNQLGKMPEKNQDLLYGELKSFMLSPLIRRHRVNSSLEIATLCSIP